MVRPKATQITDLGDCVILARIFETIHPKSSMLKEVKTKNAAFNSDLLYAALQEFVQTRGIRVLPPENFLDFDPQTETFCRHLVVFILLCALQSEKKKVFLANIKESLSEHSIRHLMEALKAIKADILLRDALEVNSISENLSPSKSKLKKQVSFGGTEKFVLDSTIPIGPEGNFPPKLKKVMERLRQNQPPLTEEEKEAISVSGLMEGYVKSVDGFHFPQKEIDNLINNKSLSTEEVSEITSKIEQHSSEVKKYKESHSSDTDLLRILEFYENHLEKVISKLEEKSKPSFTSNEKNPSFLLGALAMMFCLVCVLGFIDYTQYTQRREFTS